MVSQTRYSLLGVVLALTVAGAVILTQPPESPPPGGRLPTLPGAATTSPAPVLPSPITTAPTQPVPAVQPSIELGDEAMRLPGICTAVGISPDGRFLVATDADGEGRIWDLQEKRLHQHFAGGNRNPGDYHFRGHQLICLQPHGWRVIDLHSRRQRNYFSYDRDHPARSADLDPRGELIAVAFVHGGVQLYDRYQGTALRQLSANPARYLAWGRDGDLLHVLGADERLTTYDRDTWQPVNTILLNDLPPEPKFSPRQLFALAPDCESLLIANPDDDSRRLSLQDGKLLAQLPAAWRVRFSPDGELVLGTADPAGKSIVVWRRDGTPVSQINCTTRSHAPAVFHPTENRIIYADGSRIRCVAFQ